jgi:recombinational DNA repair protein (RecF pathway)
VARWIEQADRLTSCARCHARIEVGQRFYYLRRGTYLCEMDGSLAEHEVPEVGEVESGVLEDLDLLPPEASKRTLAKLLIKTARLIDSGEVADRDVAPLILQQRATLKQLQDDFPPAQEDDDTEKTRKRIEKLLLLDGELSE